MFQLRPVRKRKNNSLEKSFVGVRRSVDHVTDHIPKPLPTTYRRRYRPHTDHVIDHIPTTFLVQLAQYSHFCPHNNLFDYKTCVNDLPCPMGLKITGIRHNSWQQGRESPKNDGRKKLTDERTGGFRYFGLLSLCEAKQNQLLHMNKHHHL